MINLSRRGFLFKVATPAAATLILPPTFFDMKSVIPIVRPMAAMIERQRGMNIEAFRRIIKPTLDMHFETAYQRAEALDRWNRTRSAFATGYAGRPQRFRWRADWETREQVIEADLTAKPVSKIILPDQEPLPRPDVYPLFNKG